MNVNKLSHDSRKEILRRVGKHLIQQADTDDDMIIKEELNILVDYYLKPLSEDDFFGTEGWEVYFGVYD